MATKTENDLLQQVLAELKNLKAEVRALKTVQNLSDAQKYQVEAISEMARVSNDARVKTWAKATVQRIHEGAEFGSDTKTYKVVGSRRSTPEERILRLTGQATTPDEVPFE